MGGWFCVAGCGFGFGVIWHLLLFLGSGDNLSIKVHASDRVGVSIGVIVFSFLSLKI
ncbi:hypothetical protein GYH30_002839 [Glycine max]|nr:hypothetical protein GYH30_002839 [Glycine max]